ncbi:MAG: hypothetical protein ACYCZR_01425 [Burkholderiales bacterium]
MSQKKRIFFGAGVFVVVALVGWLGGCAQSPEPNTPYSPPLRLNWPLDHTGTHRVQVLVPAGYNMSAGAEWMEAVIYPHGRPTDPHNVQQDMLLETLWPEMGPHTVGNNQSFEVPGMGRMLMILIGSGAVDPAIHARDRLHIDLDTDKFFLKQVCIPPPSLPGKAICHDLDHLYPKPGKFGLKRVGVDFHRFPDVPKAEYRHYNDLYYTPDMGADMQTYVSCTADEVGPTVHGIAYNPLCQQYFIFRPLNAVVQVTYRRVYLKDWSGIQSAVGQFLQSTIVSDETFSRREINKWPIH